MRNSLTWTVVAVAALAAVPAFATPQSDFDAVYGDWKPDNTISPCAFTEPQLQNAYDVATSNPDFQYETGFSDDTQGEIARWKAGACAGTSPVKARRVSPLNGARITKVAGKGKQAKESVRIKNTTKKAISFRKATLRNRGKTRATFPSKFKLRPGKTAIVRLGCAKGKKRAYAKGKKVWLCRRKQLFRDRGDVARLMDAKATVVSQRGFGSLKRRAAY